MSPHPLARALVGIMPSSPILDTSAEAEAVQLALVRKMTPAQRLDKTFRLTNEMLRLSKAAIRRRYPELSAQEVGLKFVELHYGECLAQAMRNHLESR